MRINEQLVCQLIESEPPKVVLVDDTTGTEIVLDIPATKALMEALAYFAPHMGLGGEHITAHEPGHCWTPNGLVPCPKHMSLPPRSEVPA